MNNAAPPHSRSHPAGTQLLCDLTQSWSDVGGGVGTYLRRKRAHILERTGHRHLLILPSAEDELVVEDRAITVRIASPPVPGNPSYRLLLRNRAVRATLEQFEPDIVECQDAYNLPWAALGHRRRRPQTVLVAGYFTDFPTAYLERPLRRLVGAPLARAAARLGYAYCGHLYKRFDAVFGLSENGGIAKLRSVGVPHVAELPLGVELGDFDPSRRDPALRSSLGVADDQPLLIYAGRLDREKRAAVVVDAFKLLPPELGAKLALLGEGPLREGFAIAGDGGRIIAPGFVRGRSELARWLASADIYVSAMADETFGVSVIEAQAAGLPVVGVAAGAMIDRVDESSGRLGPVDDPAAMARNILAVWQAGAARLGAAGRSRVARQFSWDQSMERLFGEIYPAAIARRAALLGRSPGAAAPLVKA